jgi:hypothetical protein
LPCQSITTLKKTKKMLHKKIENKRRKVHIYRQKNPTKKGHEYFLLVLTLDLFGNWVLNENYKQKTEINSEQVALRMANQFLQDEF